jgi:molybdate transport system permease protein
VLWLPAALALAFLVLPLLALLVRTPWSAVPELLLTAEVAQALRLSLVCATSATLVCLVLGVPLAWVLARAQFPGRSLVRALVTVPLVLPPVVGGVALPFLVVAVEGALRGADRRYEDAAATLGASRLTIFRRVTLPLVLPGVAAGAVLCFARALGEFGATITFAGSYPGVTRTMPIEVYLALETDPDRAVVLSLLLLAVSVAVLVGLRDRWLTGGANP